MLSLKTARVQAANIQASPKKFCPSSLNMPYSSRFDPHRLTVPYHLYKVSFISNLLLKVLSLNRKGTQNQEISLEPALRALQLFWL